VNGDRNFTSSPYDGVFFINPSTFVREGIVTSGQDSWHCSVQNAKLSKARKNRMRRRNMSNAVRASICYFTSTIAASTTINGTTDVTAVHFPRHSKTKQVRKLGLREGASEDQGRGEREFCTGRGTSLC
jgi:hypothetical protein